MNKGMKYGIGLALVGLIGYNSVYLRPLSEVRAAGALGKFDPARYAETFWTNKLLPTGAERAVELSSLLAQLKTDKNKAFDAHAHALGIGNIRYFLVKGEGVVSTVGETDVTVQLTTGATARLATEYIYSNAARDASGLIQITEFSNTADLNSVAAELNDIIRKRVVPGLRSEAKPGRKIRFVGAVELNRAHLRVGELSVISIQVF